MLTRLLSNGLKSHEARAQRWLQLSVMLAAGITPPKAISTLNQTPHRDHTALSRMVGLLERGQSLTSAFKRVKLLSDFDEALLGVAEKAGRADQALKHISNRMLEQSQQRRMLETSLLLPQLVLLIGGFAAIFIRVFQYQQSFLSAAVDVLFILMAVFLATRLFVYCWSLDTRVYLSMLWPLDSIKRLSTGFQNRFDYAFYRNLSWQIQSGIASDESVGRCALLLNNKVYQKQVKAAVKTLQAGHSLAESMQNARLVLSDQMRQVLLIADQTGTSDASINKQLDLLKQSIDASVEQQIIWLPKAYYVLVLWVIVTQLT